MSPVTWGGGGIHQWANPTDLHRIYRTLKWWESSQSEHMNLEAQCITGIQKQYWIRYTRTLRVQFAIQSSQSYFMCPAGSLDGTTHLGRGRQGGTRPASKDRLQVHRAGAVCSSPWGRVPTFPGAACLAKECLRKSSLVSLFPREDLFPPIFHHACCFSAWTTCNLRTSMQTSGPPYISGLAYHTFTRI